MKTKIHAIAGGVAFLVILAFWVSTLLSEIFTSHETIALVKNLVLWGMMILIPAMAIVGASGASLGANSADKEVLRKKKRMPIIAATGLLLLVPAAFFLEMKASNGEFDRWFYIIQAIELLAGASNLRLMILNIRDGLRATGKIPVNASSIAKPSIKAQSNGPLLISGIPEIKQVDGESIATKQTAALCRCGASKKKPFCDGSHNKIGFSDQISSDRTEDKFESYQGKDISIHYNKLLCSHAGICGNLKAVFDPNRTLWIDPDKGAVDEIKKVIKACPSGALSFSEGENNPPQHLVSNECCMSIETDGPYHVSGITLETTDAMQGSSSEKYVLCRCGTSKNKPYCDGSHVTIGWKG